MNAFAIRNRQTKQLIRISTFSNEGSEFCNAVGAKFEISHDTDSNALYVVDDPDIVRRALESDPGWYNASLERPEWPAHFDPKQWEVVALIQA